MSNPEQILRENAGALVSRKCRETGTVVTIYDARSGMFSEAEGLYATVCEPHGGIVVHESKKAALTFLSHPTEWCPDCQESAKGTC